MLSLKRVWMVCHYDGLYRYNDAYRKAMLKWKAIFLIILNPNNSKKLKE